MWKRLLSSLIDFRAEPVRAVARITSALTTLATITALWGFPIGDATQNAILVTAPTAIVIFNLAGEFMRQFVYPVPIALEAVADAQAAPAQAPGQGPTPSEVLEAVPRQSTRP